MEYLVNLVLVTLATFYITYAVVYTDGIGNSFIRLRNSSEHKLPFGCFVCTAIWVALALCVMVFGWDKLLLHALAVAGLSVIIDRYE